MLARVVCNSIGPCINASVRDTAEYLEVEETVRTGVGSSVLCFSFFSLFCIRVRFILALATEVDSWSRICNSACIVVVAVLVLLYYVQYYNVIHVVSDLFG